MHRNHIAFDRNKWKEDAVGSRKSEAVDSYFCKAVARNQRERHGFVQTG